MRRNRKVKRDMDWITGLQKAIDYVEEHLEEDLDYMEIARQAASSSFQFQRVFGILCGCTLGEYIRKRRLTLAGSELAATDMRVLDAALKYGYDSPESFCRAFTRFHGITPSAAKAGGAGLRSFSRLSVKLVLEGGTMMNYRIEKHDTLKLLARTWKLDGKDENIHERISGLWAESGKDGTIALLCQGMNPRVIKGMAGVCLDNPNEGEFVYAIGREYAGGDVPDGLTVVEFPAATWVAFSETGRMPGAFDGLWKRIYTEFFPTSGYEPVCGPTIEVYPGEDVYRPDYSFEIWMTVKKKES